MSKYLIIVESPAKIKTLKKFLGPEYAFESSIGHIRDLPEKGFGIDVENDFTPVYEVMSDKKKVMDGIIKAAKKSEVVYLAPDPDREGEAIAWHIASQLPEGTTVKRVTFNSITKEAVCNALNSPRDIDYSLVNAQQARRLLDRIVGYKISPILARRIQGGRRAAGTKALSAGRVQSVALKLVVERERDIDAFKPIEYWNVEALLKDGEKAFTANLYAVEGKRIEKELQEGKDVYLVDTEKKADEVEALLRHTEYNVTNVERKEKRRNPVPPFITSTLQQEASRHFGFSATKTMSLAQGLYEGIDMKNEGQEGIITYMRTDSVRIAPEAVQELREFIVQTYGDTFLEEAIRVFPTKKSAQDAHEGIRPTNMQHPPDVVKAFLSHDQFLLYSLIWKRFIASQMKPAVYNTVAATVLTDNDITLRATGSELKFQGFLVVYEEKGDEDKVDIEEDKMLPFLEKGMTLNLLDVNTDQSFTRPPARYSEASLVKELEKSGVGRPSTYAAIMNKIQSREYTAKEKNRLKPTELGKVMSQMLEANFQMIMDIGFTSSMEDKLELVADNDKEWKSLIKDFWEEFIPTVEAAEKDAFVPKIMTEVKCPRCGANLQKIWSRNKYFYGCSGYPECSYTTTEEELFFTKEDFREDFDWNQMCPICQTAMKVRHGRFGYFLGCTKYPDCKGIINIPKKDEDDFVNTEELPPCPAIDCPGRIIAKRSRYGKIFYSCSTFPECNVIVNDLSDLEEKYRDYQRTPYEKKERKGKGKKATKETKKKTRRKESKPRNIAPSKLSPELSTFLGVEEMARTQVMKKVWEHIKAHNLQDEGNKRIIHPDASLATVIGNEPIDMFKMTSAVNKHIIKREKES
jgi:DNA topoisomerase I